MVPRIPSLTLPAGKDTKCLVLVAKENMEPKFYHQLWMHREMLRDTKRCEAYRQTIKQVVKPGDEVLDIGTGTGILAMFAAAAGAKAVYAVERTSVVELAVSIIKANGMSDRIRIIHDDMENVRLPGKVDVITAEWMGGFGVDENLLAAVIEARDRWLKPGGKMIPAKVTAFFAPVCDKNISNNIGFWRTRPYGLDLSPVAQSTANEVHNAMHHILPATLLASPAVMWVNDVCRDTAERAKQPYAADVSFVVNRAGTLSALAAWFSAELGASITLTNGPEAPATHWGRTVLPLEESQEVMPGQVVRATVKCTPAGRNLCRNEWSVQVGDGPRQSYSGVQGCTASPGFH